MEILVIVITGLALSLVSLACCYLVIVKGLSKKWVELPMTLALVMLTVLQLERFSVFFEKETPLVAERKKIGELVGYPLSDTNFVKDNFILINTSNDNALVTTQVYENGTTGNETITDRQKLTDLLKIIADHDQQVSLVACDLIFENASACDSDLNAQLIHLSNDKKLALAFEQSKVDESAMPYRGIPTTRFGNVALPDAENQYFTNYLIGNLNIPSLSYRIYLTTRHIHQLDYTNKDDWFINETDTSGGHSLAYAAYIADLPFQDESELYGINYAPTQSQKTHSVEEGFEKREKRSLDLAYCLSPVGSTDLLSRLEEPRRQKKIILIGNFGDSFADIHPTRAGPLHGTTLIINECYYFFNGYHKQGIPGIILYIAVMFCGYWCILHLMSIRAIKEAKEQHQTHFSTLHWAKRYIKIMAEYFFNELHYVVLILFTMLFYFAWHRIINIMALLTYFVVFNSFLKFFFKKLIPKPLSHEEMHN